MQQSRHRAPSANSAQPDKPAIFRRSVRQPVVLVWKTPRAVSSIVAFWLSWFWNYSCSNSFGELTLPNPEFRDGRLGICVKCSVLSAQSKISDIGRTRRADEIQRQTSKIVVHVFTMCPVVQISCLSTSNDFQPDFPSISNQFSLRHRGRWFSFGPLNLPQHDAV